MARASLVALGLLVLAAFAAAQDTYTGGKGMFDIFGELKDTKLSANPLGVFAGKVVSFSTRNSTATINLWIAHPYSGAATAVYFTTGQGTNLATTGNLAAGSKGGIGYVSATITNATIFNSDRTYFQGSLDLVSQATLVVEYTVKSGNKSTTFTSSGLVLLASDLDFIALMNGGTTAPCAAPSLAIATLDGVTSVNGSTKGKVWWGKAVGSSAVFKVRGTEYKTAGSELQGLYTSATDKPAVAIDEIAGEFPVPTTTTFALPTGTGEDGFPSTGCTGDSKTKSTLKVTLAISQATCNSATGKDALQKGFQAQSAAISSVVVSNCAAARRHRGQRRAARGTATESTVVTYDFQVTSGTAYAVAKAIASILGTTDGANALITAINNSGTITIATLASGEKLVTFPPTNPTNPSKSPSAGMERAPLPALATIFAAMLGFLVLLL